MSTPTTVIFDVANVIVDWAADRALRGFLPDADVDAFLDSEIVWEVNAASDAGVLLSDCVDELAERAPELVPTYRVYLERFPLTVSGPEPGTTAVIDRLLRAGVPAYGLSNWSAENFDIARRGAPVLGRLREVLVSGEIGLAKPDPAIFRYALRRWELEAADTVMIDDRQENLDSAAAVGLQTVLFTDADTLANDLRALGLL